MPEQHYLTKAPCIVIFAARGKNDFGTSSIATIIACCVTHFIVP